MQTEIAANHEARSTSQVGVRNAGALLVGLAVTHDLDHIRQGRSLSLAIWGIGVFGLLSAVTVLVLAMRASRFAAPAAVVVGVGTILGLAAVHVAPTWWALSDSYGDVGVDPASWVIVIAMMGAAAALAVAGARSTRAATTANEVAAFRRESPRL